MPNIAKWPKTRAEAQAILESHTDADATELHSCKVCSNTYWCQPNPMNGATRSFCSKQCYHKHADNNPGFKRYRQSDKGKAMRRRVIKKSDSRPEAKARTAQYQRWERLVRTLDPTQRRLNTDPWPTCATAGCHNIPIARVSARCGTCARQHNLERSWRNAGKPCKFCAKPLTRYQHSICDSNACQNKATRALRRKMAQRRRARKRAAYVETVDVMVLLEWQHGKCYHCGCKIDTSKTAPHPKSLTLDHLVPLALGGDHSYANTVASCWDCNCTTKGTRAIGEQLKLV